MSVPTMLELHDTHMSDYPGDIDVPMHSSSSEYWFHAEVTMEDDGHQLHMPKFSHVEHESTSVEVDMEPYDGEGEGTEYEMADDPGNYGPESGDLEDVDLYDASHVHTPKPVFQIDGIRMPSVDVTDDVHKSPTPPANTLAAVGMHDTHEEVNTVYQEAAESGIHSSAMETPVILSPRPGTHLGDDFVYVGDSLPDEHTAAEDLSRAVSQSVESTGVPVIVRTEDLPAVAPDDHADDEVDASAKTVAQNVTSHHLEEPIGVPLAAQSSQSAEAVDHQQPDFYPNDHDEQTGPSADPHEISEGVYIDPPPAVLLSLPSLDHVEVCLFNHPQSSSGSTTPSAEAENAEQTSIVLLLHHQPTLYYEPLASVFDALRQEDYIARIPGIADGELVIDAYDLHLTISEDNLFAREVTLHDLNVIHDGTDMSGPLRLQLQLVAPRFIIRYHALRDQIGRLNLATEGSEYPTEKEHADEDTSDQDKTSEHTQEKAQNAEPTDHQEQQQSEAHEKYRQETAEQSEDDIGDASNFNTEANEAEGGTTDPPEIHDAVGEEDTHPLDDELEYTDADDSARFEHQDASEDLDADAVHDPDANALASAGAEYTEYYDYAEPQGEDGTHGEVFLEDPDSQAHDRQGESEEYREYTAIDGTSTTPVDRLEESFASATGEVTYPLLEGPHEGNNKDDGSIEATHKATTSQPQREADVKGDNAQAELPNLEQQNYVDEPDSNSAVLESENNIVDPLLDSGNPERDLQQDVTTMKPESYDEEWNDSLDGEGEPDIYWEAEHDDVVSNESSNTLSSTTSKRRHDEIDFEGEQMSLPGSPGLKRPRVD